MPPQCTRTAMAMAPASVSGMATLASGLGALRVGVGSGIAATARATRCCHHQAGHPGSVLSGRRPQAASPSSSLSSFSLSTSSSSPSSPSSSPLSPPSRAFSSTPARPSRKLRRSMRDWFNRGGAQFQPMRKTDAIALTLPPRMRGRGGDDADPSEDGDRANRPTPVLRPFPMNPLFVSQPVLGEKTRELVWERVMKRGESIKAVSAELSIDMRRIAAVIRLKELEKSWEAQGIPLARPYARAVLAMLPTTNYGPRDPVQPHESVNDVHVHGYTRQQLFVPVAESRTFTREDAARAFHPTLLPPEKRIPIPELVPLERDVLEGRRSAAEGFRAFRRKAAAQEKALIRRDNAAAVAEEKSIVRVNTDRFQFRIRDYNAENVGHDGRGRDAVGWRYGVPLGDRRRGQVKIPTRLE